MATAEQIIELRQAGKSWAIVATELGLKTPGKARATYTELTGKHHNDIEGVAVKAQRRSNGNGTKAKAPEAEAGEGVRSGKRKPFGDKREKYAPAVQPPAEKNPHWGPDSDQDEIIAKLEPIVKENPKGERYNAHEARIVIQRGPERAPYFEELKVGYLIGLAYEQGDAVLAVHFRETLNGNFRAVDVAKIVEVQ